MSLPKYVKEADKLEKANGNMLCADVIVLVPLW